jgi:predicted nucleic acid-binding protein
MSLGDPTVSWPNAATATTACTDTLIAAAAAEHGGIAVLHRDAHFHRLAEVLTFESVALPGP